MRRYALCLSLLCLACSDDNGNGIEDSGTPDDLNTADGSAPAGDTGTDAAPTLPVCTSPVATLLADALTKAPAKNSDGYSPLSSSAASELRAALKALFAGDLQTATVRATAASYEICREGDVVLWRSTTAAGHAALALRTEGTPRPVVVGVPHPIFELTTPQEGLDTFTRLKARALVVAGSHRCASTSPSSCSGTTGVCGTAGAPYPISDAAHNVESAFQLFHEELLAQEALVVLSLHGMKGDGISVSDGTTGAVPADSLVAKLAPLLAQAFPNDSITSCNPGAGVTHQVRLCGTTNVQGRLVNGASAPCTEAATSASGRFLHLEQSPAVRTQVALVVDALDQAL